MSDLPPDDPSKIRIAIPERRATSIGCVGFVLGVIAAFLFHDGSYLLLGAIAFLAVAAKPWTNPSTKDKQ